MTPQFTEIEEKWCHMPIEKPPKTTIGQNTPCIQGGYKPSGVICPRQAKQKPPLTKARHPENDTDEEMPCSNHH
jgi:hypothetical protein